MSFVKNTIRKIAGVMLVSWITGVIMDRIANRHGRSDEALSLEKKNQPDSTLNNMYYRLYYMWHHRIKQ